MKLENQATLSALDGPPQLGERGPRKTKHDYDDSAADNKPKRHAPRHQAPPPPSAQDDLAPIRPIPGAADDRPAPRKPRQNPAQKKERRDHGDALVEKRPGKPPYKGKPDGKKTGKPGYKPDAKPRDPASSGKPAGNARDTSKRFVPPGGKASPRAGAGKGPGKGPARGAGKGPGKAGHGAPRRGKP